MTTDILLREDTGSFAAVRVVDPGEHVSAPYSRAVGLLDRWVRDSRHAVDEFAAWIEGRTAQAAAEMRALCDELGLPDVQPASVQWAELPEDDDELSTEDISLVIHRARQDAAQPLPEPDAGDALLDWWVNVDDDPGVMPGRVVRVGRASLPTRNDVFDRREVPSSYHQTVYDRTRAGIERLSEGWTPDPADYGPRPVLEQGPRGGFWRRVDAVLERWDDWLRRKQAERDKRMGAAE